MLTTKWQIFPESDPISKDEIDWLKQSGLDFTNECLTQDIAVETKTYRYFKGAEWFLTTTSPEQETWVKLYWGDRAVPYEWTSCEINNFDND